MTCQIQPKPHPSHVRTVSEWRLGVAAGPLPFATARIVPSTFHKGLLPAGAASGALTTWLVALGVGLEHARHAPQSCDATCLHPTFCYSRFIGSVSVCMHHFVVMCAAKPHPRPFGWEHDQEFARLLSSEFLFRPVTELPCRTRRRPSPRASRAVAKPCFWRWRAQGRTCRPQPHDAAAPREPGTATP